MTATGEHPRRTGGRRVTQCAPEIIGVAPEWLTRRQAATIAGVTRRTIDRWRDEGRLTTARTDEGAARIPVLIRRDDLLRMLTIMGEAS
jgi:hypothetical protein